MYRRGSWTGGWTLLPAGDRERDGSGIRDSRALVVAQALHDLGATVTVTDPKALDNARKAPGSTTSRTP
ncbi:hypothetical protein [Streptomyces sp. R33]|uniref:Uncharacterized protein n=1 Tax=Streptomyces sp. R33 TaxID=3238629 RepID=A0AB39YG21_9ACTN